MAFDIPILMLVFNRPEQAGRVFEAIRRQKPSSLFIAADGPRASVPSDEKACAMTRHVCTQVDWTCDLKTRFLNQNLGCKNAVSSAIDWFFSENDCGIILEDDCLPSDAFFPYCKELLTHYQNDRDVMMISGWNPLGEWAGCGHGYYFTRIPHIWGWATWRRAWAAYDGGMTGLRDFLRNGGLAETSEDVDLRNHWASCFIKSHQGIIDTWDYPWTFSIFKHRGICIAPGKNLIQNIGFGSNATHTTNATGPAGQLHDITITSHHTQTDVDDAADLHDCNLIKNGSQRQSGLKCIGRKVRIIRKRRKIARMIERFLAD